MTAPAATAAARASSSKRVVTRPNRRPSASERTGQHDNRTARRIVDGAASVGHHVRASCWCFGFAAAAARGVRERIIRFDVLDTGRAWHWKR